MAIFEITEGAPGMGKSLYTAQKALELLKRNKKWYEKTGIRRKVVSNMRFSGWFEDIWKDYLGYWSDSAELIKLNDVDIIWDEIATELDARNFANLSVEMKRFLSQYRKRGVDIYANTQDFSMIDMRARLMITKVRTLRKILGSRDISTTKPPPRFIWGLVMIRDVLNWRETDPEKKVYEFFPSWLFIDKQSISIYDTRQDIPVGAPAPLKHEERICELHGKGCDFHKTLHQ